MKVLFLGGTRFVGKAIVDRLILRNHDLTLFTRGQRTVPSSVEHIKGDRNHLPDLALLEGRKFDVIIDSSARKKEETEKVISIVGNPRYRLIYISSAGIYNDSNYWPLDESSQIDFSSRHFGKFETEQYLRDTGIPFTSFRPTYIYGPGNYNPIEKWFFDRISFKQPIPIPGNGEIITQLGHVNDLAEAIVRSLDLDICNNKVYNCSGKKGVTINGLISFSAKACNIPLESLEFINFDPTILDPKARKLFPIRISHFLTDISLIEHDLNWTPEINLEAGLLDSYNNDYLINNNQKPDFSNDRIFE